MSDHRRSNPSLPEAFGPSHRKRELRAVGGRCGSVRRRGKRRRTFASLSGAGPSPGPSTGRRPGQQVGRSAPTLRILLTRGPFRPRGTGSELRSLYWARSGAPAALRPPPKRRGPDPLISTWGDPLPLGGCDPLTDLASRPLVPLRVCVPLWGCLPSRLCLSPSLFGLRLCVCARRLVPPSAPCLSLPVWSPFTRRLCLAASLSVCLHPWLRLPRRPPPLQVSALRAAPLRARAGPLYARAGRAGA